MFITLEGIDGCGKSTISKMLKLKLEEIGFKVFITREPGGTDLGKDIRKIILNKNISPISEFLLFAADRAEHAKVIKKHLKNGEIVISDRFADSSVAYQGYGLGLDIDFINEVNEKALNGLKPDATFILDIPIPIMLDRFEQRGGEADKIEKMDKSFFEKVRTGYLMMSQKPNVYVIDATNTPKIVLFKIMNILLTYDKEIKEPALKYVEKITKEQEKRTINENTAINFKKQDNITKINNILK